MASVHRTKTDLGGVLRQGSASVVLAVHCLTASRPHGRLHGPHLRKRTAVRVDKGLQPLVEGGAERKASQGVEAPRPFATSLPRQQWAYNDTRIWQSIMVGHFRDIAIVRLRCALELLNSSFDHASETFEDWYPQRVSARSCVEVRLALPWPLRTRTTNRGVGKAANVSIALPHGSGCGHLTNGR